MRAVITDVDGTLCDYIGIAWVRFLGANQYISNGFFDEHETLVEAYRRGMLDHITFTREWVSLYGRIVAGKRVAEIGALAKKFAEGFRKGMPKHSLQVAQHFRKKKYRIVAITGSPRVPAALVLKQFGIGELHATELEAKGGIYTGEVLSTMHLSANGKEGIVRDIITRHGIDTSKSFALGDTVHDLPLLESVAYPIAINPKGRLGNIAREKGFWIASDENVLEVIDAIEKSGSKSSYEQMKFIFEMGVLKHTLRSGWAHILVENPESVAEHMMRTSVISYLLAVEEGADPYKCAFASLVHDLGEGRITDLNKITLKYINGKEKAEGKAFRDMVGRLDDVKGKALMDAWESYSDERVRDVCKDADLLENLASAREYECKGYRNAREWIVRILRKLKTPTAKRWGAALSEMDPNSWWFGIKTLKIR